MMRSCLIHPAFFSDAKVARLSLAARLYFVACWLHTDDYGNFCSDPEDLYIFAFPGGIRGVQFNESDGAKLMAVLLSSGLVLSYKPDGTGKIHYHVPGILRHQERRYIGKPKVPLMPGQEIPAVQRESKRAPREPAEEPKVPKHTQRAPRASSKREPMPVPSYAEVEARAREIGLPEKEANKFHAYHTSKGWKVGKEPMIDWRAALQTWKLNYEERQKSGGKEGDKPFWM